MKSYVIAVGLLIAALPTYTYGDSRVPDKIVYTLYRSSALDSTMRIHVATFDAAGSEAYNRENCAVARDLFRNQPGVTVAYWCEKGYVKNETKGS